MQAVRQYHGATHAMAHALVRGRKNICEPLAASTVGKRQEPCTPAEEHKTSPANRRGLWRLVLISTHDGEYSKGHLGIGRIRRAVALRVVVVGDLRDDLYARELQRAD